MREWRLESASIAGIVCIVLAAGCNVTRPAGADEPGLWRVYEDSLKGARYVDLTHTITPSIPVWAGFGPSTFEPDDQSRDRQAIHVRRRWIRGDALHPRHRSARHAARSAGALGPRLPRDRRAAAHVRGAPAGRDLHRRPGRARPRLPPAGRGRARVGGDARAHPRGLGGVRALRLVEGLARSSPRDPHAIPRREPRRAPLSAREPAHPVPWPRTARHRHDPHARRRGLAACTTATRRPRASRTSIRCRRPVRSSRSVTQARRRMGGYARYVAICPPDWKYGVTIGDTPDAPLPRSERALHWDAETGMRVR